MPFAICGVNEVPAFASVPLDHIISIKDKSQHGPNLHDFRSDFTLHSFSFEDTGNVANKQAVTEPAIRRLIGIYQQTSLSDRMLFHCYAGISRSTAAAFIWMVHHGIPCSEAYEIIVQMRGVIVCPNQLMVKLADDVMGHKGEMASFMSRETGRRAPERDAFFKAAQGGVVTA